MIGSFCLATGLALLPVSAGAATSSYTAESLARFQEARFGMFIHWSPSSLWGVEIMYPRGWGMPAAEYARKAMTFNPQGFDAKAWVRLAKDAGARYIVFTTKHHDGFAMFDTAYSDMKITRTPFRRDVLAELARACREAGMPLGLYYSIADWSNPDAYHGFIPGARKGPRTTAEKERFHPIIMGQVRELAQNYGPIYLFWFDIDGNETADDIRRAEEVEALIRKLQPRALINDRLGPRYPLYGRLDVRGDFETWEQKIPERKQVSWPWEVCMTIGTTWGYASPDHDSNFKSAPFLIQRLARAAGEGGNLLLNVGPGPDGRIPESHASRMREIGRWLRAHGETIYGTSAGPYPYVIHRQSQYASTRRGDRVYLFLFNRPASGWLKLPSIPEAVEDVRLLRSGEPLTMLRLPGVSLLRVPEMGFEEGVQIVTMRVAPRRPAS